MAEGSAGDRPRQADYIVVGGGSSGAAIAARLSEDPAVSVILLEAGGDNRNLMVQIPSGFAKLIQNRKHDWSYEPDLDATINDRRQVWSSGRGLGGGSALNGQIYIRGTRRDFDWWAEAGATGWNFDEVFPYFIRSERWEGEPSQAHGMLGAVSVKPNPAPHPLAHAFLKACEAHGMPTLDEYNGGDMAGAFLSVASQRGRWRSSTEAGYLRAARHRPNLTIITHAEVKKILFEGRRAAGVSTIRDAREQEIRATREVIVSAGAIGSPALLMRSGIGDGSHLKSVGVEVVHHLAAVGRNLQEHPTIHVQRFTRHPTLNSQVGPFDMVRHLYDFIWKNQGALVGPIVHAMALARTRADLDEPDVQLHFLPLGYPDSFTDKPDPRPAITLSATPCHPLSRGCIELKADGSPRIVHRFFENERDLETLIAAAKLMEALFDEPALADETTTRKSPKERLTTRDAWAGYVRGKSGQGYHPVGTCRMGKGLDAVVDPSLRVHGIDDLRVADGSVMPRITSGNTNAACIMIGEKAADLIRAG